MPMSGPPHGIPIEKETHDRYPENVKKAWETFHNWWSTTENASRDSMPDDVLKAMNIILEAPIPGYDGATGKDSCYMIGVLRNIGE